MLKPLPNVRMTISKPTSAHWSIAARTFSGWALRTCIISGFSVLQGAIARYTRRCASERRSRSSRSGASTHVRNVWNVWPGATVCDGPSSGPTSSTQSVCLR